MSKSINRLNEAITDYTINLDELIKECDKLRNSKDTDKFDKRWLKTASRNLKFAKDSLEDIPVYE